MDDGTCFLACDRIKELQEICRSDDLCLTALQQKINILDDCDIRHISQVLYREVEGYGDDTPFLHHACMNKNVTLEIIKYLMNMFSGECQMATYNFCPNYETISYPLHIACFNKDCPNDVIRFLVEYYPPALEQFCIVEEGIYNTFTDVHIQGLPIHYYLARNSNVDIDLVKIMVEAYPQCLKSFHEEGACYPIHALLYNQNAKNLQEILTYLIELDTSSALTLDEEGRTPLLLACGNKNVNLIIVQFLFNIWPEAIRIRDSLFGYIPIHRLCLNEMLDDVELLEILQFIISIDPVLVREFDGDSVLPIHHAIGSKSFEFCKVLIDMYPESLKETTGTNGFLPIHLCCKSNRTDMSDTLQYLLGIYPEGINVRDHFGGLPIHRAAAEGSVDGLELLLMHDPDAATRKISGLPQRFMPWKHRLPLHIACAKNHSMKIQILYDVYPDAIDKKDGQGKTPLDLAGDTDLRPDEITSQINSSVIKFLQTQLSYFIQAQETDVTKPDKDGRLPLHHALKDGAPLGSIKLLLKGNASSVQVADNKQVYPLHLACQFSSAKVVRYLIELDDTSVNSLDINKDSILHYACRGAKLDVVQYLLTNYTSLVPSAMMNTQNELPIHVLCEAGKLGMIDCESSEYIETIWQMLLINPEAIMS